MHIPSPAVAFVGRHNSGKTTIIEQVIAELVARGHNVGSIKHHSHNGDFEIDYPGKDSYRHRAAGACETVICSPTKIARIKTMDHQVECSEILETMPDHDIVIVEGYRKSGIPSIEIMRAANKADACVARAFVEGAKRGLPLNTDFTQLLRHIDEQDQEQVISQALEQAERDIREKMPEDNTLAVVTDIPEVKEAAAIYGIAALELDNIPGIVDFLEETVVRPRVTVVIQAGGESRRMGRSKATVPFGGFPMICRLIERVSPAADELIITTNEAENLTFVNEMYPELNIKLVKDAFDFRGALPGLCTALRAARGPFVAVVACDMVMASSSLIIAEALEMNEGNWDVVVPTNNHGYEPFHAVYRKDTCLPVVERCIEAGDRKAQAFFDQVRLCPFTHDRVLQAEPRGGCFVNANTPEELEHLESFAFGN